MKALVLTDTETLSYTDTDALEAGPGECMVEVSAVGVCGSDMHAYLGHDARRPTPIVLGHEAAGTVRGGALDGQRVTVNPLVPCGGCKACRSGRTNLCPSRQILSMPPRPGAFAEAVVIPEGNLVTVPQEVSFQKAALAEPLAVCWHAVRLCDEQPYVNFPDCATLVIGGGAIGVGSALALKAFGAGTVTVVEPSESRAAYLRDMMGLTVVAPGDVPDNSFDVIVDAVGLPATRAASSGAVVPGGVICHIGLGHGSGGLDERRMTLQEITFFGTYTYTAQDFRDTAAAMFDGQLGPLDWIVEAPLSDGAEIFRRLRTGEIAVPKAVLIP